MKKDIITLGNIKSDLGSIAFTSNLDRAEDSLVKIIGFTIIAVLLGVCFKRVFISAAVLSYVIYETYFYIKGNREYKKKEKALENALERCDFSISIEELDHIEERQAHSRHTSDFETEDTYHFKEGSSWTAPLNKTHYWWSKEYRISTQGLKNVSVQGDKYYYVSLQGYYGIAYIYPCKFFELDSSIELKR